jgi:hypothetical protein
MDLAGIGDDDGLPRVGIFMSLVSVGSWDFCSHFSNEPRAARP